jgi:hypothetical protein
VFPQQMMYGCVRIILAFACVERNKKSSRLSADCKINNSFLNSFTYLNLQLERNEAPLMQIKITLESMLASSKM